MHWYKFTNHLRSDNRTWFYSITSYSPQHEAKGAFIFCSFFFTLDTYKAHICGLPNEKKKYHKVKYHYCTYCSILTLIDVTSGFELIRTAVTCRSLESWCKLPELFCDSLFLFAYIPNAQYCKYFVVGEPFGFSLFFFLFDVVVLFPMISIASKIHLSSFINIIADILKFKLY